jgi:hypothetical protein
MTTELATINIDSILDGAMEDSYVPQLVTIEIIHANATFSIEGMPSEKRLTGIILAAKRERVYFPKFGNKDIGDGIMKLTEKRPLCASRDGINGELIDPYPETTEGLLNPPLIMIKENIAMGGLKCKHCPLGQFGSNEKFGVSGRGQACNDVRRLLFWKPDVMIPMLLTLSPTSIRAWDGYCSSLAMRNLLPNRVISDISLSLIESGSNKYSKIQINYNKDAPPEIMERMMQGVIHDGVSKPMVKMFIDLFSVKKEITAEDYFADTDDGNGDGL